MVDGGSFGSLSMHDSANTILTATGHELTLINPGFTKPGILKKVHYYARTVRHPPTVPPI